MKQLIASLFLALLALPALANPLYYSRCDTVDGVAPDASCVAGNDSWNGLSPVYVSGTTGPKLNAPTSWSSNTTYRFNRAGGWDVFGYKLITGRTNIVVEPYTPATCTGDCATRRPKIGAELNASLCPRDFFYIRGASSAITIREMHFLGKVTEATVTAGCGTARAVYYYGNTIGGNQNHVFENNTVERTTYMAQIAAVDGFETGGTNAGIKIRGNTALHVAAQGIFGGADRLLIENNLFDGGGWEQAIQGFAGKDVHHIYVSSSGVAPARNMIVRGNVSRNQQRLPGAPSSTCGTTPILGHGYMPDLTIEYNTVIEDAAEGGCWGIVIDGNTSSGTESQHYNRMVIRGNKVIINHTTATGTLNGIGCSSCPDAIIENNLLVFNGTSANPIVINTITNSANYQPARGPVGDSAPGRVTIRNNSIYNNTGSASRGACIAYRYAEYSVPVPSVEDVIVNNLCVYGASMPAAQRAFGLEGQGPSRFAAFSNNVVYKAGGTAPTWSDAYSTMAAFETAFGAKAVNNSQADPNVTTPVSGNDWLMAPNAGSILIDAGHTTRSARTDLDRYLPAGARRDIGAREYNRATVAPLGPTGARTQ